jgi:acetyl/propionyl-CoA carboxylase alpha subunit
VVVSTRDCSLQRRHQKLVEEAPAPFITDEQRELLYTASKNILREVGYVGAGTCEFLIGADGTITFLEVNTRLQVEHPITEMITGLDIVRIQLEVAAGNPLPMAQEDVRSRGHAIECRIYAEDPEKGFYPSPGRIIHLEEPTGPGIRNDCGIYAGFQVPVEYDPILSKLIAHAQTREQAIERMIHALRDYVILGVRTSIPILIDLLESAPFRKGDTFTDFIDTHFPDWKPDRSEEDVACAAFIIDELSRPGKAQGAGAHAGAVPSPWQTIGPWGR